MKTSFDFEFILTADWHLSHTPPRCRADKDWTQSQRNVVSQIVAYGIKYYCPVIVVGDVFNAVSDTTFEEVNIVLDAYHVLADKACGLAMIAGNHDLPFHSTENISRCAVGTLFKAGVSRPSVMFPDYRVSCSNFDEPDDTEAEIVFKHVLCFPSDKERIGEGGTTAKALLDDFPKANLICTGDYHHNFVYAHKGQKRLVVNPGCIMRRTSDMVDYQPGVYRIHKGGVDFLPLDDVAEFVTDSAEIDAMAERISTFVDALGEVKAVGLDYPENVRKYLADNKVSAGVSAVVEEMFDSYYKGVRK